MGDLSYLAKLSDEDFERERCKLIGTFLDSAPPELRKKLLTTQMKIDEVRDTKSRDELIQYLCREMSESLENLSDQFVAIRNTLK